MQVEMTTQMAQRQKDELVRMEAVRTENIFAVGRAPPHLPCVEGCADEQNHSLLTTVSKSRNNHAQSSQRPQRNGMKTPMPNSPSRRGQEDARPLMSSSKGKGELFLRSQGARLTLINDRKKLIHRCRRRQRGIAMRPIPRLSNGHLRSGPRDRRR